MKTQFCGCAPCDSSSSPARREGEFPAGRLCLPRRLDSTMCPAESQAARGARIALLVVVCVYIPPAIVAAQSGTALSVQTSALFVGLSGKAYEGVKAGPGAEVQLRINVPNAISAGAGVQYSYHAFDAAWGLDKPLSLLGAFLEPRYVIHTRSTKVAPYVAVRLAILRQSTSIDNASQHAMGAQVNGGGGLLVALTSSTNLDFGVTVGAAAFGRYSNNKRAAGSGSNQVFRLGASFAVGK